jgi:LacI family transcriptional regulator, galactose operon repressor
MRGFSLPTIKEIAERAEVSYSTVSRALNNKKGVRPEVRESVLKLAREMKYFPDSSAKALVKKRVGVIGVVISRTSEFAFQNPYYSHVLLGLSAMAAEHDYRLMLSINEQGSYAALHHRRLVDGVVVVANRMDDDRIPELVIEKVPAVAIPGFLKDSGVDIASANSENYHSVYRAISYLIGLGHRDIAFILGQMNSKYTVERLEAYKAVFKEKNLEFRPEYIKESDFTKRDGFRLMGQLLDLPNPPSSVLCITDAVTPGALHQISGRGLTIPKDISVVAIGCSDNLELFEPPLTTIKIPAVEVGRSAARMLIQLIEEGRVEEKHVVIDADLIVRESTDIWRGR